MRSSAKGKGRAPRRAPDAWPGRVRPSPTKKYRQLLAQYGPEHVALLTGDTAVNHDATLRVMTTEILRNAVVVDHDPLLTIGYVVDEVHFLADRERGVVWEEMLVWCPKHIQLVCLSATVSNAAEVAAWLGDIHGPTALVRHDERDGRSGPSRTES